MTPNQALKPPKNKAGRPKGTTKVIKKEGTHIQVKSANWRIVIPNLQQYKDSTPDQLMDLKYQILDRLNQRQKPKGLQYYHIAIEHHANGVPHLDILLLYGKSIQYSLTHFDYLLKHGDITTYRKVNDSILNYGKKQDLSPLSNLPQDNKEIVKIQDLKNDPYRFLQLQMLKDPLHFNLEQYCRTHDLYSRISGWTSIKAKLKDSQMAAANLQLKNKPGFRYIDRALIQSQLTPSELHTFDSWSGYQTIVDYLNQIVTYGSRRPFKSKQLLLVGSPDIGKTTLVLALQPYIPVYHTDVSSWFPKYQSGVYRLVFWDQFKLKGGMTHTDLLKFLQGSMMDLQYKGGSTLRTDNPLMILTSNLNLNQHINLKFKDRLQITLAKQNLESRIHVLSIPHRYKLFLLTKLILSPY